MKNITKGELWELVETVRDKFNNIGVMDGVIDHDLTEYSSQAFAEVMDGETVMTGSLLPDPVFVSKILTR